MPHRVLTVDEYWSRLTNALPAFPPDQQEAAVAIYRELAKGAPLGTDAVARALNVPARAAGDILARHPLRAFVYADGGSIVGFGGLAVAPMHHEFRVNGRTLWTWCAWDSLFIPALLDRTAEVSSPDPVTHEIVRLTVSPTGVERVTPSSAVVSFLLPDEGDFDRSAENVMGNFCHYVFFFASPESAAQWRAARPGTLMYSPGQAFELGARLVARQFGHARRRGASGSAGAAGGRLDDGPARPLRCPASGTSGARVALHTVKALLTETALRRVTVAPHGFCPDPDCPVVYFTAAGAVYRTSEVRVPVWQKEPLGPRMVCYCFGEHEADIRTEIERTGASLAVARVRAHIEADRCACDVRNPRGVCCLSDVEAAIKRVAAAAPSRTSRRHAIPAPR